MSARSHYRCRLSALWISTGAVPIKSTARLQHQAFHMPRKAASSCWVNPTPLQKGEPSTSERKARTPLCQSG